MARKIIFKSLTGSMLYGTNTINSDVDEIELYIEDLNFYFGCKSLISSRVNRVNHIANDELDIKYYELIKFAGMLKNGNPNIVDFLYNDNWQKVTDSWISIQNHRKLFLSKKIINATHGMATSDMRMAEKREELRRKKYVNALMFLRKGSELLIYEHVNVCRTGIDADELLSIKTGEMKLQEAKLLVEEAFKKFEKLESTTKLPDEPNHEEIDHLLKTVLMSELILNK